MPNGVGDPLDAMLSAAEVTGYERGRADERAQIVAALLIAADEADGGGPGRGDVLRMVAAEIAAAPVPQRETAPAVTPGPPVRRARARTGA